MSSAFAVRTMRPGELELALEWARQEGWNPGLDDAIAFHEADPSGFFVGAIGEVPVGCISVVKYAEQFAFVGLYMVHPDFRGKGYGKAMWDRGVASAGNRTLGLDGVAAQQDNYAKAGFKTAYRTVRYGGIAAPAGEGAMTLQPVPVSTEKLDALLRYDAAVFAAPRYAFVSSWCATRRTRHSVVVRGGGKVRGYGTIRRCFEGHKIGPLFANDPDVAGAIFASLVAEAKGRPVYIDVPVDNEAAVKMAQAHGLKPIFETARMYRGAVPAMQMNRIFGVTTLELG